MTYAEQELNWKLKLLLRRTSQAETLLPNLLIMPLKEKNSFYLGCRLARGEVTSEFVQSRADELDLLGVTKGFEYIEEEARLVMDYTEYQTEATRMLRTWTPGRQPMPDFLQHYQLAQTTQSLFVDWKKEGF